MTKQNFQLLTCHLQEIKSQTHSLKGLEAGLTLLPNLKCIDIQFRL